MTQCCVVGPTLAAELESPHLITDAAGALLAGYVYAGEHPVLRFGPGGPVYYLTEATGSVVALVDATGTRLARFTYDGFGNLQGASGVASAVPAEPGGDFRFQGAWLDAATGLYHMRARAYDPRTGRFLSRDPAEPTLVEPESWHPYLFAYANPHVYRDPTGTATLQTLNVGLNVQGILQNIRTLAFREFTNYFRRKAGEITTRLIFDFLQKVLPDTAAIQPLLGLSLQEASGKFERLVEDTLCSKLFPEKLKDGIWLEAELGPSGKPLSDGDKCGRNPDPAVRRRSSNVRPDYIFSVWPPTQLRGIKRGLLVGDFKIGTKALYNAYVRGAKRGQWEAIAGFARQYQYLPVALFITLYSDAAPDKIRRLEGRALAQRVVMAIVTLH